MKSAVYDSTVRRGRAAISLRRGLAVFLCLAVGIGIAACEGVETEQSYPESSGGTEGKNRGAPKYSDETRETVFGDDGFNIFGGGSKKESGGGGSGIAVNSFLWRASLDTIAFMPLSSADPFGGVIITDWYSPPEAPSERYKMSVYILGRELRADGIKVAVFRERATGPGNWVTSPVSRSTPTNLENQILTRARQLRVAASQGR